MLYPPCPTPIPHPARQELDNRDQQHVEFWSALSVVADHELAEAQRTEEIDRAK